MSLAHVSELIQRHGFGVFVALILMAELLGFNPYSPLREISALAGEIRKHDGQAEETKKRLDQLILIQQRQADLQAITARQACLANARTDEQRRECAKIN